MIGLSAPRAHLCLWGAKCSLSGPIPQKTQYITGKESKATNPAPTPPDANPIKHQWGVLNKEV